MPIQTRDVFTASMGVEPAREAIFNEVYDAEHVPALLACPGGLAVARFKAQEFSMTIGGQRKTIVLENETKHTALYEIESPEVLTSDAWAKAVDSGRWPAAVRPFTKNRRHVLCQRIG
jgi:hypothetical protein